MQKEEKDFGYLGYAFQLKLISQIIKDKKFADTSLDVIEPVYFDSQYFRLLIVLIKDYFKKYENTPSFDVLEQLINTEIKDDTSKIYCFDIFREIKNQDEEDFKWVQGKAIKFCKQQEMKKAILKIGEIIKVGDEKEFDKAEKYLRKALEIGEEKDEGADVFFQIDDVLSEDYRHPIPTGIKGIDNLMNGGLSKGEIGLFIAALGTGKTTFLTKVANSAYNSGKNVLQIFFEDNRKDIQRKHLTCWTGIPLNELHRHADGIKEEVLGMKDKKGKLFLKKFPSYGTTLSKIRGLLRKLQAKGIKIDVVVLDYLECILPENSIGEEWMGEGRIMRQFENLATEFEFAGWAASQGNRNSISADVLTVDKMGGNIKKAQIGHFVISAAKSLAQREMGLANIAVLKSRFGKDGIVFKNCRFDNSKMLIDTEESQSFFNFDEEVKTESNESGYRRVREIMNTPVISVQ